MDLALHYTIVPGNLIFAEPHDGGTHMYVKRPTGTYFAPLGTDVDRTYEELYVYGMYRLETLRPSVYGVAKARIEADQNKQKEESA